MLNSWWKRKTGMNSLCSINQNGYGGIENLSQPGNVGAAPMQNIGHMVSK